MINQSVIVGRIVNDPKIKDTDKGNVLNITLAVPRPYKNQLGGYDTDFIDAVLWKGVAESTAEYCKKGDLVGVKGRLETRKNNDGQKSLQLVADKVTFLSTKQKSDDLEEEKKLDM